MKFFLDTEFIENGTTIDLISLGIVAETGETLYLQNQDCNFDKASDWVAENVFPGLKQFDLRERLPLPPLGTVWEQHSRMGARIADFVRGVCDVEPPEFWGYYADYDWVVVCQLFGTMMDLPNGFPMYCNDLKQLCQMMGDPKLPKRDGIFDHNALDDALEIRDRFTYLRDCLPKTGSFFAHL